MCGDPNTYHIVRVWATRNATGVVDANILSKNGHTKATDIGTRLVAHLWVRVWGVLGRLAGFELHSGGRGANSTPQPDAPWESLRLAGVEKSLHEKCSCVHRRGFFNRRFLRLTSAVY